MADFSYQRQLQIQNQINQNFQNRTLLQTRLKQLSGSGVSLSSNILARQLVAQTAKSSAGVTGEVLSQIGLFYNDAVRSRRRRLETAYSDVGRDANRAVAASYRRTHNGNASYRANAPGKMRRDSGGKLLRALTSEKMFLAGPDGLSYVNNTFLSSQARQWYRLNFGAGQRGAASKRPANQQVMFFGQQTSLNLSLKNQPPAESFKMPAGLFRNGNSPQSYDPGRRGQDRFDPSSYLKNKDGVITRAAGTKQRMITTKGITSRNFLDPGVAVVAKGVPNVTTRFIRQILEESFQAGGAVGPPAKAGLDTKDIEILLTRTAIEVEKLPRQSKALSAKLNRLF